MRVLRDRARWLCFFGPYRVGQVHMAPMVQGYIPMTSEWHLDCLPSRASCDMVEKVPIWRRPEDATKSSMARRTCGELQPAFRSGKSPTSSGERRIFHWVRSREGSARFYVARFLEDRLVGVPRASRVAYYPQTFFRGQRSAEPFRFFQRLIF